MFIYDFIRVYSIYIFHLSPVLLFLGALIIVLALMVGKKEKWNKRDSIYFGFITATTVGYGDKTPKTIKTRFIAILITFIGLITTGIFVAAGMQALTKSIQKNFDRSEFDKKMEKVLGEDTEDIIESRNKQIEDEVHTQINAEVKKLIEIKMDNLSKIRENMKNDTTNKGE